MGGHAVFGGAPVHTQTKREALKTMTDEPNSASSPAVGGKTTTLKLLGWLAVGLVGGTLMAWLPGLLHSGGQSKASLLSAVAGLIEGFTYSLIPAIIVVILAALFGRAMYLRDRLSKSTSGERDANH